MRLLFLTGFFLRRRFPSKLNDSLEQIPGEDARLRQAQQGHVCRHLRYRNFRAVVKNGAYMRWQGAIYDRSWTSNAINGLPSSSTGLVAEAAYDEVVSSFGSLIKMPSLMLLTTSVFGTKRKGLVLKKSGSLIQLLDCKTSADTPRVPASAGLSQVVPWFHWSTLLFSKISLLQFAIKMGCLLVEFIHCNTLVLSVHMNTSPTVTVKARPISLLKRAAMRVTCNSSFGTGITFIEATRTVPSTNASPAVISPDAQVTGALRQYTALNTSFELLPNIWSSRCWNVPEK